MLYQWLAWALVMIAVSRWPWWQLYTGSPRPACLFSSRPGTLSRQLSLITPNLRTPRHLATKPVAPPQHFLRQAQNLPNSCSASAGVPDCPFLLKGVVCEPRLWNKLRDKKLQSHSRRSSSPYPAFFLALRRLTWWAFSPRCVRASRHARTGSHTPWLVRLRSVW